MGTQLMHGKKGIVLGVANERSIAWGIAKALHAHGADVAFTYQGDILEKRVRPLAESLNAPLIAPCDVSRDEDIHRLAHDIKDTLGHLDFVVHSIAFAHRDALKGPYYSVSRDQFAQSLDISCYSFTALCREFAPLFSPSGASCLSLSYYGAEKVIPQYNVMGVAKAALEASIKYLSVDLGPQNVRVNGISAGPLKTLAASGVGDLRFILNWNEHNTPLKRNITLDDVGNAGLYLLSDLSSGVTGEIHHVDCGFNAMGMKRLDSPPL